MNYRSECDGYLHPRHIFRDFEYGSRGSCYRAVANRGGHYHGRKITLNVAIKHQRLEDRSTKAIAGHAACKSVRFPIFLRSLEKSHHVTSISQFDLSVGIVPH